jgi:arsenate reductase
MTKTIIFICTGNACRSQMAEGFAKRMLPGWRVLSAGTIASGVHETAIKVMGEAGIDITGQYSKTLDEVPVEEIDYVVTLCGDARDRCPAFPRAVKQEHWPIDDPIYSTGSPGEMAEFRRARDDIGARMGLLAKKLTEGASGR